VIRYLFLIGINIYMALDKLTKINKTIKNPNNKGVKEQ